MLTIDFDYNVVIMIEKEKVLFFVFPIKKHFPFFDATLYEIPWHQRDHVKKRNICENFM